MYDGLAGIFLFYYRSLFLIIPSLDKKIFCVILLGMKFYRERGAFMSKTYVPAGYQSVLTLYETQNAIGVIHHAFEEHLGQTLNLKRVSAPLFVDPATGLNDNLSGVERPVTFDIPATGTCAEVVHSLAKWKRMALYRYDFRPGKGLFTNMNAIRRDETLDNLHSIYVDQWDWERVITPEKETFRN
jgi:aspartate--ammonia ligase